MSNPFIQEEKQISKRVMSPVLIKKILVCTFVIIILAIISVFSFIVIKTMLTISMTNQELMAALNLNNGGGLACNNSIVVFLQDKEVSITDSEKEAIIVDAKGNNKGICAISNPSKIYIYNNAIYGICSEENNRALYRMNLDGKEAIKIMEKESITDVVVYNRKIYYTSSEGVLYATDLNGENEEIIVDKSVIAFCIASGRLYYGVKDGGVYELPLKSKESKEIVPNIVVSNICAYNGYLYFTNNYTINRVNLTNNIMEKLPGNKVANYVIQDGRIIFKENLSEKEEDKIWNLLDSIWREYDLNETMDLFYKVFATIGMGNIMSMNLDGTDYHPYVFPNFVASSLYVTPNSLYMQLSYYDELKPMETYFQVAAELAAEIIE